MKSQRVAPLAGVLCLIVACAAVVAQPADAPDESSGWVELNFPEDVELKALVDYVGQRQGVNFIYDMQSVRQKITLKTPEKIPASSLMTLLESALKVKNLTLVPTEVEGVMRIDSANQNLTAISQGPVDEAAAADLPSDRPTLPVTRVFTLQHADAKRLEQIITPFVTASRGNLTALPEHDLIIVTDFAGNMGRIGKLIELVDRPGRKAVVRFVPVTHVDASDIADQVRRMLTGKAKAAGQQDRVARGEITVLHDERTNQVAVIGLEAGVADAVALIESLDVPLGLETKIYPLTVAFPGQVDSLVRELIGEIAAKRLYKSAIDPDANLLIATTTPDIHEQINALRDALDRPIPDAQSPVRFYKLENAKAADVLATLRNIEGGDGLEDVSVDGMAAQPTEGEQGVDRLIEGPTEAGINRIDGEAYDAQTLSGLSAVSVELPDARIMADEATNTVIIIAKPSMQAVYKRLIDRLDVRRPQVLIEATVVSIDTTDGFELGVEIHSRESADSGTLLNFTQFGLTTEDSRPGSLTLTPGTGFTGALLGADTAEFVIRALESDSRARVISRPTMLVNDNFQAELKSENEEPFETVSVSSTSVERTTLGGYATAGTTIRVTPQISQGNHLKLEYEIALSSFGEKAQASTLPPKRQTNELSSEATIPDGDTIVVGGLSREDFSESVDRVPLLGSIPLVEYLFSSRSNTVTKTTLFVFIHATILRDDKFEDLKMISGDRVAHAGLEGDYPPSEPVAIR